MGQHEFCPCDGLKLYDEGAKPLGFHITGTEPQAFSGLERCRRLYDGQGFDNCRAGVGKPLVDDVLGSIISEAVVDALDDGWKWCSTD